MADNAPNDAFFKVDPDLAAIENIETHINLKDASVASEAEIASLEVEQECHRDNAQKLEETNHPKR